MFTHALTYNATCCCCSLRSIGLLQTREALLADLKVSAYLSQAQATSSRLLTLYTDADGTFQETISSMAGGADAALASFYSRLADVHDHHKGHGDAALPAAAQEAPLTAGLDAAAEAALSLFTSEELYGRYVDMGGLYEEWANLPGVRDVRAAAAVGDASETAAAVGMEPSAAAAVARADYIAYLRDLPTLHSPGALPSGGGGRTRGSRQYRKYVTSLASYLVGFIARAHPLVDIGADVLTPFARDFAAAVRGVAPSSSSSSAASSSQLAAAADSSNNSSSNSSSNNLPPDAGPGATPASVQWAKDAIAAVSGSSSGSSSSNVSSSDNSSSSSSDVAVVDLAPFGSPEDLMTSLSADDIRAQLKARGLKVGGTPEERAARLWSVRGLAPGQYPKKLLAAAPATATNAAAKSGSNSSAGEGKQQPSVASASAPVAVDSSSSYSSSSLPSSRAVASIDPAAFAPGALAAHGIRLLGTSGGSEGDLVLPPAIFSAVTCAWLEDVSLRCASALGDVIGATARRAERRLTKTYAELEAERAAEEEEASRTAASSAAAAAAAGKDGAAAGAGDDEDSDDDEDKPIYNPLNLPLGWDGKPMPYWLWKLQGLNIPYSCEICGGAVYYGRRNFDRHFQEWRHATGMRALGIPNTKHFHDVTGIADAQALYAKLRGGLEAEAWRPEAQEEFEDSAGNVLNRRTYQDLARAGLL